MIATMAESKKYVKKKEESKKRWREGDGRGREGGGGGYELEHVIRFALRCCCL